MTGATTAPEDSARQRTTTSAATFILPAGDGLESNPPQPIARLFRSSLFTTKQRLEQTEILHFALLLISTPLASTTFFSRAEDPLC